MPLRPVVSALARQTIKAAYDELDRTITPGDKTELRNTTLQHVRKTALDIENQLAARQSLRNMRRLMPLFQGLEHYAKVVDVLCNGTPFLSWIWAPIILILRVASEYVEAFEKIIKGYSSIAESLKRFEILSDAFINEPEFQKTLAIFYADILQFHKHAYKFIRRSSWKLMFLTSWGRFERRFSNILEDLKQHGYLIDQEANARNIAETREMREDIRTWREESQTQVHHEEIEESAKHYESIVTWLKINESDQLAIFDSISSEASEYQGTCGWILNNERVRSWSHNHMDTPALWLQGSAGTGKSVLCTQLVNFMKASNLFVVHHFCSYLYASSITYEQILKSFLLQIVRKDGDLVAHVYETCVLGKKLPTTSALEQLLQKLLASMSSEPSQAEYLWIIVDGLDECELDKQMRLVRLINQMISKPTLPGNTSCKVLIASRTPSHSLQGLRKQQIISLSEQKGHLHGAIRQYVGQRLKSLSMKFKQLDIGRDGIEEIQTVVVKKVDGMFLYARLVVDYLSSNIFYSSEEIKTSVNQLPKEITDFYQKILTQIMAPLDARSVDRIRCVLGWVAFAQRPLQRLELLSAISFSPGDPDVARLTPQYILDICGTLVEERKDSRLTFIHISVKEFLQTPTSNIVIDKQHALHEHGVASVTCLLSGLRFFGNAEREQNTHHRVVKGVHGFHIYATEYWTEYLLSHPESFDGLGTGSSQHLVSLACQLADELENLGPVTLEECDLGASPTDERLGCLQQHTILYKHVDRALRARSLKNLEARMINSHVSEANLGPKPPLIPDGISTMLNSYQEVVRSLLSQTQYPGISTEELELFKVHFGTAAFTCRLNSCPRATLGFETKELRSGHEMSHLRRFRCNFSGCQYPPFVSARALRNHTSKYHTPTAPQKAIRRAAPKRHGDSRQNLKRKASTNIHMGPIPHDIMPGNKSKALREAARDGDVEMVYRLYQDGANLDDPEALVAAALEGHEFVVHDLLYWGNANPDPEPIHYVPSEPLTPMLAAIGRPNIRIVEILASQSRFNPTRLFNGRSYFDIIIARKGPNWGEEFDILSKARERYLLNQLDNHTSNQQLDERPTQSPQEEHTGSEKLPELELPTGMRYFDNAGVITL
ncbi:hypothetical protein FDECE_15563 [Fusarium decemcellulare]|nr:hypothetical protein FDECE_15563 [Fusarium decemcellulare]